MNWLRWYHGTVSDCKWPLISRRSGQSIAVVIAVWAALLECASQSEPRGSIEDFDAESLNVMLGLEDGSVESVVNAMCVGNRPNIQDSVITSWGKRQFQSDLSTERVRKYREKQKESASVETLQKRSGNATETHGNGMKRFETQRNAMKRPDTDTEQNRNKDEVPNGTSTPEAKQVCSGEAASEPELLPVGDKLSPVEENAPESILSPICEPGNTLCIIGKKTQHKPSQAAKTAMLVYAEHPNVEQVAFMPLISPGKKYSITQGQVEEWSTLFPAIDVMQELRNMYAWCDANPENKKTDRGVKRFMVSWLSRAQNRARPNGNGNGYHKPPPNTRAQYDKDVLDAQAHAALAATEVIKRLLTEEEAQKEVVNGFAPNH